MEPKDPQENLNKNLFEGYFWILPTDIKVIEKATEEFEKRIQSVGWDDELVVFRLRLAFEEALENAMVYGNLGRKRFDEHKTSEELVEGIQPSTKQVKVELTTDANNIKIVISDEGSGFDWKSELEKIKNFPNPDPSDPSTLLEHGRGITLMQAGFDTVEYNEKGNQVTLIKTKV